MINWLKRLLQGRYGVDPLSFTLIVFAMIFSMLGTFFIGLWVSSIILATSYILIFLAIFRAFSKNIFKRQQEYFAFVRLYTPLLKSIGSAKLRFRQRKTYKFYTCPQCKQKLRLPKGKGSIVVTCPKCQAQFNKKT